MSSIKKKDLQEYIQEIDNYFRNDLKTLIKTILIHKSNYIKRISNMDVEEYHVTQNKIKFILSMRNTDILVNNQAMTVNYINIDSTVNLTRKMIKVSNIGIENFVYNKERTIPTPEEQDQVNQILSEEIETLIKKTTLF